MTLEKKERQQQHMVEEGFTHFEQRINHLEIAVAALQKGVESIRDDIVAQNAAITRMGDSHTAAIAKLTDTLHGHDRTQWGTIISAGALILGFVLAVGNAWVQPIRIETDHNRMLIDNHAKANERQFDHNYLQIERQRDQLEKTFQRHRDLINKIEERLDNVRESRFTDDDGERLEDRIDQIEQRLAELRGRCEATRKGRTDAQN